MIVVLAVIRNLDALARYKYSIGILGVILLLLPIVIGQDRYGAKLWISFGAFTFQPGELAKIAITLFLANNNWQKKQYDAKNTNGVFVAC